MYVICQDDQLVNFTKGNEYKVNDIIKNEGNVRYTIINDKGYIEIFPENVIKFINHVEKVDIYVWLHGDRIRIDKEQYLFRECVKVDSPIDSGYAECITSIFKHFREGYKYKIVEMNIGDDNNRFRLINDIGLEDIVYKEYFNIIEKGEPEEEIKVTNQWNVFRDSGMLWYVNSLLHLFGWAIVLERDGDEIKQVYPKRVNYRGFSEKSNTNGYRKVTEYLKNNIEELVKEVSE